MENEKIDSSSQLQLVAVCKDTVASISEPVLHNSYGLSDGAWMRDARGHGKVIYLTNGHYGTNLLEFRDMDTFTSGTGGVCAWVCVEGSKPIICFHSGQPNKTCPVITV